MLKKLIDWLEHQAEVWKMESAIREHAAARDDVLVAQHRVKVARERMDKLIAGSKRPMALSDWHKADV